MKGDGVLVIGLAGGIGSGKSTVASMLEGLGCAVVDSDAESRAALRRPETVRTLISWWGEGILDAAGAVDRAKIASIVFSDQAERERLEGLIHPMISRSRAQAIEAARERGVRCVVIDAPLLFEAGLDAACDATIVVDTPRALRLERVRESRGWDEGELDRRERAQWSIDEKRARADHVVLNDSDLEALRRRVGAVYDAIRSSRDA